MVLWSPNQAGKFTPTQISHERKQQCQREWCVYGWYSLFRSCCKINNCSTNTTTPLTFIAVHSCRALRFRKWFHCKSKVRRLVFFSENKTNTIFYHYTQQAYTFGYCILTYHEHIEKSDFTVRVLYSLLLLYVIGPCVHHHFYWPIAKTPIQSK